jgi:hypothetical protein
MLVWARAYAFSYKHGFPLYVTNWFHISLGSWWRWERSKRMYLGYFKPVPFLEKCKNKKKIRSLPFVPEPMQPDAEPRIYLFEALFRTGDYFEEIRPFRDEIKNGFIAILKQRLQKDYIQLPAPIMGVHIRRGDFKLGSTVTPIEFFISVVEFIRKSCGRLLPVTVFSDATNDELKVLLALPEISRAKPQPDILDLLQLSKSAVVVISIGSSFSFWAGFMSEGIIVKHKDEWHPPLLSGPNNTSKREFAFNMDQQTDELLAGAIKQTFGN